MPRTSRIVIAGCPHHVTQRGNNQENVFSTDEDREVFLGLLREASARFGLTIEGYCLMTNHVHLIATPAADTSLAMALKRTNQLYAQYANYQHARTGHLWQSRFYSCPLGDAHFWKALAYVERNPVRAHLCRRAWCWVWSSAAAHCGGPDGSGLLDLATWTKQIDPERWKQTLTIRDDPGDMEALRLWTSRGRPWGTDRFVNALETRLGLRLRPLPRGRPKKPTIK
ncbi:MAG: transposase [Sedimentisphaerales bacterium]|nr:transposase [Sedimentisphaerales bacterium]